MWQCGDVTCTVATLSHTEINTSLVTISWSGTIRRMFPQIAYVLFCPVIRPVFSSTWSSRKHNMSSYQQHEHNEWNLTVTSGYVWWFTAAPKPLKIQVFWVSPSPQGSYSPYILGDTTRPGHVTSLTCVLVWSKSDRRHLRKTLHKQTDRQTDRQTNRHYKNNGHLAVNQKHQNSPWKIANFVKHHVKSADLVHSMPIWCFSLYTSVHSDCCFFAPCRNILTYLLTLWLSDRTASIP